MWVILLAGFVVIAWSGLNWFVELKPFIQNRHRSRKTGGILQLFYSLHSLTVNTYRFFFYGKFFILDVIITTACASVLGMDGLYGSILGLFLSNIISLVLLLIMKKDGMFDKGRLPA